MKNNNNNNNIEIAEAYAEAFLEASRFLKDSGCYFIQKESEHRYGVSILLDDSVRKVRVITPFSFALSRDTLAGLYVYLTKDEPFGGKRRIQSLLKVVNRVIRDGFKSNDPYSYNIETGKYMLKASEVLGIFERVIADSLKTSAISLKNLGDLYSILGGEIGTYTFFKEVFKAVEESIPGLEEPFAELKLLPNIKCYTCRYCKCDIETGVKTCSNVSIEITGEMYDGHHYIDAHHDEGCDALMSSIIDDRMSCCKCYKSRI